MTTYNAECYGAWSAPEPQNDKRVETIDRLRELDRTAQTCS